MGNDSLVFLNHPVCRIGFGCWQLAGDYNMSGRPNGYGATNKDEAVKAIHAALDNGINFFDTAVAYGFGRSEEILGEALKSYSGSKTTPFICTKFGMVAGGHDDEEDFSAGNLISSVEGSLKRLQAETLGIILLHNPPDDFNFADYDTAPYEKLVQQGKILAYGVSCKTQKGVANVLANGFGSVVEAVYNPLDRRYEQFFANPVWAYKYLFISRVPLASGFINPRTLTQDPVFPANDIRHNFNKEQVEWVTGAVRKLSFLQELEGGITVSALRFQLSNPYNTITIPGLRNLPQVADAVKAMHLGPLPAEITEKIAAAVPEVFYRWRG